MRDTSIENNKNFYAKLSFQCPHHSRSPLVSPFRVPLLSSPPPSFPAPNKSQREPSHYKVAVPPFK